MMSTTSKQNLPTIDPDPSPAEGETSTRDLVPARVADYTYLSALICPRKFYLRHERNLVPRERDPRMHAGSVIHVALDTWYLGHGLDDALLNARDAWEADPPDIGPASRHSYLTWGHIENVIKRYVNYWQGRETFEPVDVHIHEPGCDGDPREPCADCASTRLCSEAPLKVEMGGFWYGGRADLPVRDASGNLYIMDHKATSGNMGDYWFSRFVVHNQLRGYCAMLQRLLGEPVQGGILNGIYMGNYNRKDETAFQRRVFNFSQQHLAEVEENIEAQLAEIEWRRQTGAWPQNTAGYNCAGCDYAQVCKAPPQIRERVMERDYILEPWDFART